MATDRPSARSTAARRRASCERQPVTMPGSATRRHRTSSSATTIVRCHCCRRTASCPAVLADELIPMAPPLAPAAVRRRRSPRRRPPSPPPPGRRPPWFPLGLNGDAGSGGPVRAALLGTAMVSSPAPDRGWYPDRGCGRGPRRPSAGPVRAVRRSVLLEKAGRTASAPPPHRATAPPPHRAAAPPAGRRARHRRWLHAIIGRVHPRTP